MIPGCPTQGATREPALEDLRRALPLCPESREEAGWERPASDERVDVELTKMSTEAGQADTRAWPYSFTVMSPAKATRTLIYIRPVPDRRLALGYVSETIAADLGLPEEVVRRDLGEPPWREVSADEARRFFDAWRATVDSSGWAKARSRPAAASEAP